MRDILFRAKILNEHEYEDMWIEGYYAKVEHWLDDHEMRIIIPLHTNVYPHCEFTCFYEIDPYTLGQFTGMIDKNGERIFEGDIIRGMMNYGPAGMIETVVDIYFENSDGGYRWNYFDMDTVEVIGNIHDNPELLERN